MTGDIVKALAFFTQDHPFERMEDLANEVGTDENIHQLATNLLQVKPGEFNQLEPSVRRRVITQAKVGESEASLYINLETAIEVANQRLVHPSSLREQLFEWGSDGAELTVKGKSQAADLTANAFFQLVQTLSTEERERIVTLNLKDCRGIKSLLGKPALHELLPNLSRLDLSGLGSLVDLKGLEGCSKLETVNLSRCTGLTDLSALKGSPLTLLNLSHCQRLPKEQMDHIESITTLRQLDVSHCPGLKERVVPYALLPRLQVLSLAGNRQLQALKGFEQATHLKSLDISNTAVSSLKPLNGLSSLTSIEAKGSAVPPSELQA